VVTVLNKVASRERSVQLVKETYNQVGVAFTNQAWFEDSETEEGGSVIFLVVDSKNEIRFQ